MSGGRRERGCLWILDRGPRRLDAARPKRHKPSQRIAEERINLPVDHRLTSSHPAVGVAGFGRYAIYWAPAADSVLADLGSSWLGRDSEGGAVAPRPALAGFEPARLEAL